jgi:hypothetical protein
MSINETREPTEGESNSSGYEDTGDGAKRDARALFWVSAFFTGLFIAKAAVAILSVVQIVRTPSHWVQWVAAFLIGEWALVGAGNAAQYSGLMPEGVQVLGTSPLMFRSAASSVILSLILYWHFVKLGFWIGIREGLTWIWLLQTIFACFFFNSTWTGGLDVSNLPPKEQYRLHNQAFWMKAVAPIIWRALGIYLLFRFIH